MNRQTHPTDPGEADLDRTVGIVQDDAQAAGLAGITAAQGRTRIVSIASGKGGVGKTFVSTSLALCAAREGKRVLLVDGDLSLANVDIVLGLKARHHLGDVLQGRVTVHEAMLPGPDGLFVLAAGAGVAELTQLGGEQQQRLINVLAPVLPSFDVVIIDCGAGVGDNVLFFGRAGNESILVLTPEPTALSDAYATVKLLSKHAGVDVINVVVNQATEAAARDTFRRLSAVVSRFLPVQLRYFGAIPLDDSVRMAVLSRKPVTISAPGSSAARAMALLTRSWVLDAASRRAGLLAGAGC